MTAMTTHHTTPVFSAAEQAQLESGLRSTELTQAQLIARINAIQPGVQAAVKDAFDKMRPLGLTGIAQILQLHDAGIFGPEQTLRSIRETLGLPVIPNVRELGFLQAALYQGHYHGAASEPAVGDHYADL